MRDLFVTFVVIATLPIILAKPHIGIYVWSWLGYMNPHRLTWGFAYDFPFAEVVAITTILAIILTKEQKRIPWMRETVVLLMFVAWMFFTTFFADIPDAAWEKWDRVWKVQLFIFLTMMFITDPQRLRVLVWVIVVSLGFYGVKGGIFTINTGGSYLVLGPERSFLQTRGEIGTALNMVLPLMRYLQLTTDNKWVRYGLAIAMFLTVFAVVGTHSRGAFLGLVAVLLFLFVKSRKKVVLLAAGLLTAYMAVVFMPAEWAERMHTIQTYEEDASAMGRIEAWEDAVRVANASPLVGGGLEITAGRRATHSIYFQVLAEHGYVGLGFFLLLGILTWHSATWVRKRTKNHAELKWAGDLAAMLQVSIVAYAVGGAFISQAYFDFIYHIVAMIVIMRVMVAKKLAETEIEATSQGNSPGKAPRARRTLNGLGRRANRTRG